MKCQVTNCNNTSHWSRTETMKNNKGYSFEIITNLCALHCTHVESQCLGDFENTWRTRKN